MKAQAALDEAEAQYAALQRQLNANRAGLLAQQLQPGPALPGVRIHRTPLPGPAAPGHVTEQALEEREQALTAQRRDTAASSRKAGDAAARAAELRAALTRDAGPSLPAAPGGTTGKTGGRNSPRKNCAPPWRNKRPGWPRGSRGCGPSTRNTSARATRPGRCPTGWTT